MAVASSRSLTTSDLAWLRVQSAENLSLTTVTLLTDQTIEAACLKSRLEDRLMAHERFRQTVQVPHLPLARPRWEESDDFELADHFIESAPGDDESASLSDLVSRLSSRPLDESRPLWQVHLVQLVTGGSAVILRVHAALADCTSVPGLALSLVDNPDSAPAQTDAIGFESLISIQQILERAGKSAAPTHMLCELITMRADRCPPLRSRIGTAKEVAWSDPVALETIREQALRLDSEVVHLLMAAVTGGLRKALHRHDSPTEDVQLRAVVPLSLRAQPDDETGSRMALGLMDLPVQQSSSVDRLQAVRRQVERLCLAPEGLVVLGADVGANLTMTEIEERSLRLIGQKASMLLGVLAGPARPLRLCGRTVTALQWWPNLSGETAVGIGIVGYAGAVRFGVVTDRNLGLDAATVAADMAAVLRSP